MGAGGRRRAHTGRMETQFPAIPASSCAAREGGGSSPAVPSSSLHGGSQPVSGAAHEASFETHLEIKLANSTKRFHQATVSKRVEVVENRLARRCRMPHSPSVIASDRPTITTESR